MDLPPKTWREVWEREAEDPVPDPLVEMAKRMRLRVHVAKDAADHAARMAADPIPSLTAAQAFAYREEIAQRAREVVEQWRRSKDPRRSQLMGRAVISLKRLIEHAAMDAEPVEPAAIVDG